MSSSAQNKLRLGFKVKLQLKQTISQVRIVLIL